LNSVVSAVTVEHFANSHEQSHASIVAAGAQPRDLKPEEEGAMKRMKNEEENEN